MSTTTAPTATRAERRTGIAIAAGFGAQGLGYASVITALPSFVASWGIEEIFVSLILLGTCLTAAVGSLIANAIALRAGSRMSLCLALVVQAGTTIAIALAPSFPMFVVAIVFYGIGLGLMDASQNMQGVELERRLRRPLMGRFYAAYTAGCILGAVVMSAFLASSGLVMGALLLAAGIHLVVLVMAVGWLDRSRVVQTVRDVAEALPPLPGKGILAIGAIVLGAYMLDSSISAWGTLYLQQGMAAPAALAPLGYAAYQAAVLLARLSTDPIEARIGRARLAVFALGTGVVACIVIAASPLVGGVIVGYALAGLATGALIPIAFSAAGALLPARSDEVITRVNLFNYAGAVSGAVLLGLVASGSALGAAFLIPGAALLAFAPLLRQFRRTPSSAAAAVTSEGTGSQLAG